MQSIKIVQRMKTTLQLKGTKKSMNTSSVIVKVCTVLPTA